MKVIILFYDKYVKRMFDIIVAITLLVISLIPILLISVMIRIRMGSPIIFKQTRPGLHGKPFSIYKFRTMTNETDSKGNLLPNEKRITMLGKLLRKLSIDELPQLFNVLKGEISLVGPRPLLMEYLPLYNDKQARRHHVRPGITGWAQVNGRNNISWEDRFSLDVWYVENQSFLLDVKILFLTLVKVFKRENINPDDKEFIDRFRGSRKNESG